jgi:translation elongation factor EF-4
LAAIMKEFHLQRKWRAFTSFNFWHYNPFRGIEVIFRVINGEIKKGQKIKSWLPETAGWNWNFKIKPGS